MRAYLLPILLLCTSLVHTQVIDLLPEGPWQDVQIGPFPISDDLAALATDTNDVKKWFLIYGESVFSINDKIQVHEFDTTQSYELIYPIAQHRVEEITTYFYALDTAGNNHFLKFPPFTLQAEEMPLEGNWRAHIPFSSYKEDSFVGAIINDGDSLYYPATLEGGSLDTVSSEGYSFMIFGFDVRGERVFGFYEDEEESFLCLYDPDVGFKKTSVPSAFNSVVT